MKRSIMFIAMLIGMIGYTFAQGTGAIWGRVVDAKTGESLPNANIVVKTGNTMTGCQADLDGNFKLKGLAPGLYDLELTYTGYGPGVLKQIYVYADGITPTEDFKLTPGVELSQVVIHEDRVVTFVIQPKAGPDQIDVMPSKHDLGYIVSTLTSDVQRGEDGELYFRGARNGDFVYYIDGVKTNGANAKVPATAIGSIVVYTGGVPARYGDFTGGCVVIETQSYFDWLNSRN